MPPELLTKWAPVLGPTATSLAVIISLFVVFRDFHWKRKERRFLSEGQARSVLTRAKKDDRGFVESYDVQNQGKDPIFDVSLWSLAPDGSKQHFATDADHRFFQFIASEGSKTADAPAGARSLDDPATTSIVAIMWRDSSGQHWARLGWHAPFRTTLAKAANRIEKKRAALVKSAHKKNATRAAS